MESQIIVIIVLLLINLILNIFLANSSKEKYAPYRFSSNIPTNGAVKIPSSQYTALNTTGGWYFDTRIKPSSLGYFNIQFNNYTVLLRTKPSNPLDVSIFTGPYNMPNTILITSTKPDIFLTTTNSIDLRIKYINGTLSVYLLNSNTNEVLLTSAFINDISLNSLPSIVLACTNNASGTFNW